MGKNRSVGTHASGFLAKLGKPGITTSRVTRSRMSVTCMAAITLSKPLHAIVPDGPEPAPFQCGWRLDQATH